MMNKRRPTKPVHVGGVKVGGGADITVQSITKTDTRDVDWLGGTTLIHHVLEWLRRGKRVPPEKEGLVHLVGFALLISAIIVISANDINRLIQGGTLLGG